MPDRPIIWSYGGGTQSVAIWILVEQGRLPMPERIIMADTDYEASEVWEYHEEYIEPRMQALGTTLEIVPHSYATVDFYGGKDGDKLLIPAFTKGGEGKIGTFCSNEWKKRVVRRYLREKGYGPKNPVVMWLGMSIDEIDRLSGSGVKWIRHEYPLCGMKDYAVRYRRHDSIRLVEDQGLPEPPRSACHMCPLRSNAEWRHLRDNCPEDWQKAKEKDRMIRERDIADGGDGLYIHHSGVPLEEADLGDDAEEGLFGEKGGCETGYCFV